MPLITETYYLSLTQDNRGILRLRCSQDDTLRTVNLKLYNNGSIFAIPSGVSASISGVKQNGAVFSKPCTISQNRESVVLQLSSDITNVDGIIVAEIVLNDGEGGRLGTSNFIIQVEKNPIRAGVVQDTETPIEYINDFIEKIQTLTARLNNLITPSGDPSLAEVVDARIGILDSTTYQTLGARLNAEFQKLSNALNGITILESTGDTTDRTSEILSKLNAYGTCKLGKGDFYVSSLVMPEGSHLVGSGNSTRVILPSSVTNGYIVKPRSNCIVENISFYGGFTGTYSELIASGSSAQRHCIILDRFDSVNSENIILSNIFINNFVGSAIIQRYTIGCHCENVIINMCYAGIDISNASYDGQFTNVSMSNTRFGVVQNGSNFVFTNCVSKDSAYHIMSDQQNTGCTFSSCSFSESSLETTSKLASISNAREGVTFDNCLFDSSLSMLLNACDGIVIKGTNFVGSDTFAITVSNGRNTLLFITDCIADVEPTVTNAGTAARITSCYLKDGTAWSISEADITVDDELSDESENPVQNKVINRAVSEIKADLGAFSGYSSIPVTGTGYIVLNNDTADINSPVTNASYRYSVYPCSEGDTFTVNATGASKGRAWGFVDANGNVLSKSNANVTVTGLVLTAPASAAYLVINDSSSSTSYVGDVKSNSDLNTEISVAQKKGLTGDYAQAERITSNSDLNNYTQAGSYKITTDTDGATIANLPSNMTRGRLFVMQPYNADRVIQMFFSGSNGRIYVRRYTTAWSDWTRLLDETLSALNDQSNLPVNSNAVIKGMQDFTADATNTMHLGYSWWVNNRAVDTYGNLYFGYISENSKCGVCCRFPDGSVLRHDLYQSEENDDHNAPSVIIVTQNEQEYVCVLGSTGHNTDNRMHCYLATEPNTVNCTFADKTTTVDPPEGYQYQCTYSQAYFDTYTSSGVTYNRITNFFRIRQRVLGQSHPYHMVWVCAISDDYGDTWKFYSVFAVDEEDTLFYMRGADTTSPYLKRIVLQPNTALRNYKPIKTGHVNLSTGNILTGGTQIGTLLEFGSTRLAYDENTLQYDEFNTVVQNETDYLYRILDVWETAPGDLVFIYARTTDPIDTTITNAYRFVNDWTVYRYNKGTTTEVAHLGAAFFKASHYVTGACFYNDIDHVIYSQNNSEFETVTIDGVQKSRQLQDGAHSLHIVEISNNVVTSDKVIKTSRQTIARPLRYDDGGIMILVGQYREGKGTAFLTWHFGIQFLDVVS